MDMNDLFATSLNGPWRNDACMGYALIAMQQAGLSKKDILAVLGLMEGNFDFVSVEEAAEKMLTARLGGRDGYQQQGEWP